MGQPVKLSDSLVSDARSVGETAERSIASQIELWAGLGRAVEAVLHTGSVLRLKQRGDAVPLSACLADVDTQSGRARLQAHLAALPFPHFEPAAGKPGLLVKIDADGTRTVGRFVRRVFQAAASKTGPANRRSAPPPPSPPKRVPTARRGVAAR
jgi:hypothetical protein